MKVPEIRIKGYDGEWKQPLLQDCLLINVSKNKGNKYGKEHVLSVSDDFGVVNQIKHLGRSYAGSSVENYKILQPNQIVYTKSPLKEKPYGIIKVNKGDSGIVSVLYAIYYAVEGVCADYIERYFEPNFRINKYLLPLISKGAKNTMNISDENALKGYISIPDFSEQQAIANYFQSLDAIILATTKKIDKLKRTKAASLVAMFPQKGEAKPKVRFNGFEEDWILKNVSELLCERVEHSSKSPEFPLMAFIANDGITEKGERYDRSSLINDAENKLYKRTYIGDFIYSSNNLESGSIGINTYGQATISPVYSVFCCTPNTDSNFVGCCMMENLLECTPLR